MNHGASHTITMEFVVNDAACGQTIRNMALAAADNASDSSAADRGINITCRQAGRLHGQYYCEKKERQPLTRLTLLSYTMDEEETTGDGCFPLVFIKKQ